jgi:hypothetical protein
MDERRRFPRRSVEGEFASIPVSQQVRVVDISTGGVLLHATRPLDEGTRGELRLSLAGQPFAADVMVQRVTSDAGPSAGYRIGLTFLSVSAEHLHVIERFIAP